MRFLQLAAYLLLAVTIPAPAAVRQSTTTVVGTVRDAQNGILPGVTVTLVDANNTSLTTTTSELGEFRFADVTPGTYTLRAELTGFTVVTRTIEAGVGQSQQFDMTMGTRTLGGLGRFGVGGGARAAPPPPPPPPAGEPELARSDSQLPYTTVPVLYATDRMLAAVARYGADFSRERAATDDLQYGRAVVTIPRDHRLGELESPSWLHLEFQPNPAKHVTLIKSETIEKMAFYQTLKASATDREVLVFIHGYNVTFQNALRRTGQLAYDLQFPGPAVAYTWPAQDNAARYLIAQSNVDWCKPHLVKFLTELADQSGARRIHVIVHSLGNRIFAHAVDAIVTANPGRQAMFHNVVMAAADIDVDEFKQVAQKMRQSTQSLTLYVSETDKALKASKDLAKYPRVGQGGRSAVLISGIDTVDATDVDKGFFWDIDHSYFGDSKSVIGDMWELIRCGWKVNERDAMTTFGQQDPRLWKIVRDGNRRTECTTARPMPH